MGFGVQCATRIGFRVHRRLQGNYLTRSVYEVVSQKPIPTQTRQLIIYKRNGKG